MSPHRSGLGRHIGERTKASLLSAHEQACSCAAFLPQCPPNTSARPHLRTLCLPQTLAGWPTLGPSTPSATSRWTLATSRHACPEALPAPTLRWLTLYGSGGTPQLKRATM